MIERMMIYSKMDNFIYYGLTYGLLLIFLATSLHWCSYMIPAVMLVINMLSELKRLSSQEKHSISSFKQLPPPKQYMFTFR